jgi:hypothetical protein
VTVSDTAQADAAVVPETGEGGTSRTEDKVAELFANSLAATRRRVEVARVFDVRHCARGGRGEGPVARGA